MKKQYKIGIVVFAFLLATAGAIGKPEKVVAKENKNVTITLKKGILTVKGKGAMAPFTKIKNRKKAKKIVVKKGITSLPRDAFDGCTNVKEVVVAPTVKKIGQWAFSGCYKLKEITLPGNFELVMWEGDNAHYAICGSVDTVTFNTELNVELVTAFKTNNLIVSKSDSNYKSVDGVIYSKDGKSIVRVPYKRKKVILEEGTEEFCMQSILYCLEDWEGDIAYWCRVKELILPESVKKVEDDKYKAQYYDPYLNLSKVEIRTKHLDGESLSKLLNNLERFKMKSLQEQLPGKIIYKDNMYITTDNVLLAYDGKEKRIEIPKGITMIGDGAFKWYGPLEYIKLPEGIIKIGKDAFSKTGYEDEDEYGDCYEINIPQSVIKIGDRAFANAIIERLELPDGLETIPDEMCEGSSLKKIRLPKNVKKIGVEAFRATNLKKITFGKKLKEIGKMAFCNVPIKKVIIPENVKYIREYAFNSYDNVPKEQTVIIEGSSKNFASNAFGAPNAVITYLKSPKEMQVNAYCHSITYNKKNKIEISYNKIKGADGYQTVFAFDINGRKRIKKQNIVTYKKYTTFTYNGKYEYTYLYGKIRPYKIVKGKKIFGRWTDIKVTWW